MFKINRLDNLVLTVRDIDTTVQFYQQVLGMQAKTFAGTRVALHYGVHKINLHLAGQEVAPNAAQATAGSADLCLVADATMDEILQQLDLQDVDIEQGPVSRTGALGEINSVYIRDPDGNLLEISHYV